MPSRSSKSSRNNFMKDLNDLEKLIGRFSNDRSDKRRRSMSGGGDMGMNMPVGGGCSIGSCQSGGNKRNNRSRSRSNNNRNNRSNNNNRSRSNSRNRNNRSRSRNNRSRSRNSRGGANGNAPMKNAVNKVKANKPKANKPKANADGDIPGQRSWKLVEVNGKRVEFESRTHGKSPRSGASKLFTKWCKKNSSKNAPCNATITVQEITRGSNKKEYMYDAKRVNKSKTPTKIAGRMITFGSKPVLHKIKKAKVAKANKPKKANKPANKVANKPAAPQAGGKWAFYS